MLIFEVGFLTKYQNLEMEEYPLTIDDLVNNQQILRKKT